jgi:transposase-like protein
MFMTLIDVSNLTEENARAAYERVRWPNGPVCPHCASTEATKFHGKAHRVGVYKCRSCQEQFTATVNTIMEDSHLPIRTWLMAFAILCSSKKGVSALQLQRQLGLGSYRSAWHMAHRIRHAMSQEPLAGRLKGTVEVDETYIGGKPRQRHGHPKPKKGRGTKKIAVVALVERGGQARAHKIERVDAKTLGKAIRENVDRRSTLMTDQFGSYAEIGSKFDGGHHTVNRGKGEYVRGDASTNEVESYFALLKRGVMGSFHHVSKNHLDRYCGEFSFRWNHRTTTDSERTIKAIEQADGCRLMYKSPLERKQSDL